MIPNKRDTEDNSAVEYLMKLVPFRKSDGKASAVRRQQFVELDKDTGELKLVKKFPAAATRGKKRHRLFANVTITAKSRNKKISKKFEILVEFADTLENYCIPTLLTCFPSSETNYLLPEDSITNATFDYLMNPSLPEVCPNLSMHYAVYSDADILSVDSKTGALQLNTEVDVDDLPSSIFPDKNPSIDYNVTCQAGKESFAMLGKINFTDVNDNAPTTQSGNSSVHLVYYLAPDQKYIEIPLGAYDKDSKRVNNMQPNIENDTLHLFGIREVKLYELLGPPSRSYFFVDVESKDLLQASFIEYNFSVVIEDKALQQKDRQVTFYITLIRESYENIELRDSYEVNISRKALEFSKILQLSAIPLQYYNFSLANWKRDKDWLSITNKSGIVFIRDPDLMSNKSTEHRKILWWKKNATHEISGTSILIINIDGASAESCSVTMWCSYYNSRPECERNCGKGSVTGYCKWRQESLVSSGPSTQYSACSPDLDTCPDGHCDEVEEMDASICPLDCAKEAVGTVTRSTSDRGIQKARGLCYCSQVTRCNCALPPEELRMVGEHEILNRTLQVTEVQNISIIDAGKRVIYSGDETSTSIVIIPVAGFITNGSCDVGCVILASVLPFGILLLIVAIFLVRRIKNNHLINHLKVGGSHISLSAVPSDYVQERPNSRQDSRTASEASSAGKTVLDPKWEFPRNRLQFQSILGEGEFGKVVKARASNIAGIKGLTTVAVKMLKDNGGPAEMQDLISEFTLLKDISHPNVIKLLAACTEKGGPFYLIVEYAEIGSLRSYLRKRRKHNNCCKHNATYGIEDLSAQPPREYYQFMCERSRYEPRHCFFHKEQMSYAWQIAKGMAYLADMKLVHRDLAARNVLLTKKKVVKISDFGLSRDVYKGEAYLKKSKGRVPVKWLALESFEDQIYTSRSDVWSFGIVLWEIMTQGATPYPGVTPQRLFNLLKAGYRMSKPEFCPDELYAIMRLCWRKAPNERPSFKELVHKLDSLLQDTVEYMDFSSEEARSNHRRREAPLLSFDDPSVSTIQYTSVLVENEEEFSDVESLENIGLVNLFDEGESDTHKTVSDKESSE